MGFFADIIPARWRKYVYAIVSLAALVYGAWQATGGNWSEAAASLLATLVTALAHANTNTTTDQGQSNG